MWSTSRIQLGTVPVYCWDLSDRICFSPVLTSDRKGFVFTNMGYLKKLAIYMKKHCEQGTLLWDKPTCFTCIHTKQNQYSIWKNKKILQTYPGKWQTLKSIGHVNINLHIQKHLKIQKTIKIHAYNFPWHFHKIHSFSRILSWILNISNVFHDVSMPFPRKFPGKSKHFAAVPPPPHAAAAAAAAPGPAALCPARGTPGRGSASRRRRSRPQRFGDFLSDFWEHLDHRCECLV